MNLQTESRKGFALLWLSPLQTLLAPKGVGSPQHPSCWGGRNRTSLMTGGKGVFIWETRAPSDQHLTCRNENSISLGVILCLAAETAACLPAPIFASFSAHALSPWCLWACLGRCAQNFALNILKMILPSLLLSLSHCLLHPGFSSLCLSFPPHC